MKNKQAFLESIAETDWSEINSVSDFLEILNYLQLLNDQ